MNEIEFLTKSKNLLMSLANNIEEQDVDSKIDVELQDGILTIETEVGIFVINKQTSVKEIWLSSPISGPYHFIYKDGWWTNSQKIELISLLSKELSIKLNG